MRSASRDRYNLSRWAIQRPLLAISLWLAVAVVGMFALTSLKYALFPAVTFPVAIVNGSAPWETVLETEAQLTAPLEAALKPLPGVTLHSSTYPGRAVVSAFFEGGQDVKSATEEVKSALQRGSLPPEASIEVIPLNLNESSAITYALQSENRSLPELGQIAQEKIIPPLAKLTGVLRVDLLGDGSWRESDGGAVPEANPPTLVRFNGRDGLAIQVIKREQANTLEVVSQVERAVQQLQASLPEIEMILAESQADFIWQSTHATLNALFEAIVLAVIAIYGFLRSWRATLIAALSIPLSLLGTFTVMAVADLNFETLTLLALGLTIGIVVDDAIVDVENIARHLEAGKRPRRAAIEATREIGLTVTATTFSIAAVFLPVAFMRGTIGNFFKPFGLTVSAAVILSLLVARTLVPVLAAYWLKPKPKPAGVPLGGEAAWKWHYRKVLDWSLHHRKTVVALALLSFAAGIALIPFIPQGFIPTLDRGEFNIVYRAPLPKLSRSLTSNSGAPVPDPAAGVDSGAFDWIEALAQSPTRLLLRKTRRVGRELEAAVLADPDVASAFTLAGVRGQPNQGKIYVKLKPERQLRTSQVQARLRQTLPQLPGVTASVEDILFVETGDDAPLKVALLGQDLEALAGAARGLKARIQSLPGFADVKVSGDSEDFGAIERYNGQRAVYLSANLTEGQALGRATERVVALAESILPPGIRLDLQGNSARMGEVFGDFGLTLALAILLMVLLLVWLFRSLLEPLAVLLSLPLATVGAMLGLLVARSELGMIALIGLIFLLGLLDKNAVLLLDCARQFRQAGFSRHEALVEAGIVRLRPIAMTTAATILGMLPIALGFGAGFELRQPMAVAIVGGLTTSSLLSLIVVPVIYTLLEDAWLKGFSREKPETLARKTAGKL